MIVVTLCIMTIIKGHYKVTLKIDEKLEFF